MTRPVRSILFPASLALLSLTVPVLAQDPPPDIAELQQRAETDGPVRVIIRLAPEYAPVGELSADARLEQDAAISSAQADFAETASGIVGLDGLSSIENLPLAVAEVNAEALTALAETDGVVSIVEDEAVPPTLAQSTVLINADDAWTAGASGTGQVVAILDTGVDAGHPAFAGKIVSQACFSSTSAANNSFTLCPNGQGQMVGGNAGRDCDASIRGCGHGTHVAGIAAGRGGGIEGVARLARVISVNVFSEFRNPSSCANGLAPCVLSYTSDQIRGLQRVQQLSGQFNIASANMSLGGGQFTSACDSDSRKPIIDTLRSLGIATVIASGNNGFTNAVGAPACISSAITVGSTTKSDTLSGFSNHSNLVDLLAPGSSIVSARLGGGTVAFNGTSMAAPHVAGAFAVAKSAQPNASVSATESALESNGVTLTAHGISKPRLDLGYISPGGGSGGEIGYAWANNPTAASYTPSATYAYNEGGGPITITRSATGMYSVRFAGLGGNGSAGGNVQVTGYGSDMNDCKVRFWSSSGTDMVASVMCLTPAGSRVDARYTILVHGPS